MKKLYLLILIALGLGSGLQSCKPDDGGKPDPERGTISNEVKNYAFFKKGSWWVYQDSVSGAFDTITVAKASEGIDTVKNSKGTITGFYDWFTSTLISSHDGYFYDIDLHSSWDNNLTFRYKYKPGDASGKNTYFFTPLEVGNIRGSSCSDNATVKITNYYDSLSLEQKVFKNCVEFFVSESCLENKKQLTYILSKDVGLIKKEIGQKEQNWILINYQIIH